MKQITSVLGALFTFLFFFYNSFAEFPIHSHPRKINAADGDILRFGDDIAYIADEITFQIYLVFVCHFFILPHNF
jgi:hypothetical protein